MSKLIIRSLVIIFALANFFISWYVGYLSGKNFENKLLPVKEAFLVQEFYSDLNDYRLALDSNLPQNVKVSMFDDARRSYLVVRSVYVTREMFTEEDVQTIKTPTDLEKAVGSLNVKRQNQEIDIELVSFDKLTQKITFWGFIDKSVSTILLILSILLGIDELQTIYRFLNKRKMKHG